LPWNCKSWPRTPSHWRRNCRRQPFEPAHHLYLLLLQKSWWYMFIYDRVYWFTSFLNKS
jgi:hypothetical protein